jgi:hypothetical protein
MPFALRASGELELNAVPISDLGRGLSRLGLMRTVTRE